MTKTQPAHASIEKVATGITGFDEITNGGLFVAFEESTRQIVANAATFG